MKLPFILTFFLCIIILIGILLLHSQKSFTFTPSSYEESILAIDNPCRGFYHIYRYRLDSNANQLESEISNHRLWNETERLALLEINLKAYADCDIPNEGLLSLSTILSTWTQSNKRLILRFLYDWDGKAIQSEPKNLQQIIRHMSQVAPIVNQYHNQIYLLQGIFIGDYAEMHDSIHLTDHNINTLFHHLHSIIDPSIYLSTRTPAQWRLVTGIKNIPNDFTNGQDPIASRLGLFNDGMLGSISDLGTYTKATLPHASFLAEEQVRDKELSFQNRLCRNVPNGGEVVITNPLNDLSNAIKDFRTMHITYLNAAYDPAVLKKWKQSTYTGNDLYHGMNGYDYISMHLGYRIKLNTCKLTLSHWKHQTLNIKLTFKNVGFSAPNLKFDSMIILKNQEKQDVEQSVSLAKHFACGGSQSRHLPSRRSAIHPEGFCLLGSSKNFPSKQESSLSMDFTTLSYNEVKSSKCSFSTSQLVAGNYVLYLKIMDSQTKETIQLANKLTNTEFGYVLGQINFSK